MSLLVFKLIRPTPVAVGAKLRPLLARENHYCNFSAREVLLIANVLVCRQEHLEAGVFGTRI